jgi:hypothetical protein
MSLRADSKNVYKTAVVSSGSACDAEKSLLTCVVYLMALNQLVLFALTPSMDYGYILLRQGNSEPQI